MEKNYEELLTYEGIAEYLKISVPYVKKLKALGMPHYKIGNAVRFRKSEVEPWLQERKEA